MASVNKVIVLGHLGRDPEVRYTPSGAAVCNVSLATSRNWKDKRTGEKMEETEWHKIVFYERLAEVVGEYLKKGSAIYVEGRLKTRKWEKDGRDNYSTEIIAETMTMFGDGSKGRDESRAPAPAAHRTSGPAAAPAPRQQTGTGFDDMDDDIPFIVSLNDVAIASPKARRLARAEF